MWPNPSEGSRTWTLRLSILLAVLSPVPFFAFTHPPTLSIGTWASAVGLSLAGTSIGLAVWQWQVAHVTPVTATFRDEIHRFLWGFIVIYGIVGTALVVAGCFGMSIDLGLGLAFLGLAVSFFFTAHDVDAAVTTQTDTATSSVEERAGA